MSCATLHSMNLNPDHLNAAVRQIGVIVAATGLVAGVFDVSQAGRELRDYYRRQYTDLDRKPGDMI